MSVRADALNSEASALTPLTLTLSRERERGTTKRAASVSDGPLPNSQKPQNDRGIPRMCSAT